MKNRVQKISVIIPAYNEGKFITGCLEGLRKQTILADEIIIVDNNSTDNTASLISNFPKVKIMSEKRKGVGAARKKGFEFAEGDILISTDADTNPPVDWIEKILLLLSETKAVAVTGPFLFYDRGKVWNFLARCITPMVTTVDWILGKGTHHLLGMNFAIRKEVYQASGGFNENLKFGEDIDLAKRVKKIGKIVYTKKILTYTHSRRFQPSWNFIKYLLNFLKTTSTGKPFRNELPLPKTKKPNREY